MLKIGITGQNGFLGTHLFNTLGLDPQNFITINFNRNFYADSNLLDQFVSQCDIIVHLAAINRHDDSNYIYTTNINLVNILTESLERTKSKAHLIMASSTQEDRENAYGLSKKEGREILANWSKLNGNIFTGMIIPNVFGPFGQPFYNSVIATFSYQLTHSEIPKIEVDSELNLIYVGELVSEIITLIKNQVHNPIHVVYPTSTYKVSQILVFLNYFKTHYIEKGEVPKFNTSFELNLFNTFRSYLDIDLHFPVNYKKNSDERGSFVELIRSGGAGQVSFSNSFPGITRGNHFHTRKIERFAVIKGKALVQLRKIGTDKIFDLYLDDSKPAYVDMPIWYSHNITNIGDEDLYTVFWINEAYDPSDPDTYFEIV